MRDLLRRGPDERERRWDVLAQLQEEQAGIPVVFMTAGCTAKAEAERCHADGDIAKPGSAARGGGGAPKAMSGFSLMLISAKAFFKNIFKFGKK